MTNFHPPESHRTSLTLKAFLLPLFPFSPFQPCTWLLLPAVFFSPSPLEPPICLSFQPSSSHSKVTSTNSVKSHALNRTHSHPALTVSQPSPMTVFLNQYVLHHAHGHLCGFNPRASWLVVLARFGDTPSQESASPKVQLRCPSLTDREGWREPYSLQPGCISTTHRQRREIEHQASSSSNAVREVTTPRRPKA